MPPESGLLEDVGAISERNRCNVVERLMSCDRARRWRSCGVSEDDGCWNKSLLGEDVGES